MDSLLNEVEAKPVTLADAQAENARLLARIKAAEAERDVAKAKTKNGNRITLKVSQKGALSVYGLQRWPVTLYREQWTRLLAQADAIASFIVEHDADLVTKD